MGGERERLRAVVDVPAGLGVVAEAEHGGHVHHRHIVARGRRHHSVQAQRESGVVCATLADKALAGAGTVELTRELEGARGRSRAGEGHLCVGAVEPAQVLTRERVGEVGRGDLVGASNGLTL